MDLKLELKKIIKGDIANDLENIKKYSHDASLLEVAPKIIIYPKDKIDVENIVKFVNENKKEHPELSVTGRSAGSDMTGGPLNESIILDFTKYFKKDEINFEKLEATVEPGVFYRDFETIALPKHISYPSYPASKQLAAFGGMMMNNSAGERTLRYGQTRDYCLELKMVLSDGNEYIIKPLTLEETKQKIAQGDFEGELYRKTFELVEKNFDEIKNAEPKVHKNSSGYALWKILNKEKGIFDLTQLFVGSQGTLGILTEAKVRLIKEKPFRKMIVAFFKSWDDLPKVVNDVLPYNPESMETFDDATLKLGIRFMPEIAKKAHTSFIKFAMQFLPEVWIGIKMFRMPKLIVMIELTEDNQSEVDRKTKEIVSKLGKFRGIQLRVLKNELDEEKYWIMRRESFNLLRQHVHGKRTAPFVEDFCILPEKMPEFLPKLLKILKDNKIKANIAGHAGDGNYHIIPLMDLTLESERAKIVPVSEKVFALIKEYGGTITAEHNDGIIRTPYLPLMFGEKIYSLFEEVKRIFDPQNIFNPGKKVGGSKEYINSHIAKG
ncbi:MAG: FAD-binding oxidoreductase [bacterium]